MVYFVLILWALAVSAVADEHLLSDEGLPQDDECVSAGASGEGCAVNALQFRSARATANISAEWWRGSCAAYGCTGYVHGHACQCNSRCGRHGNCCYDYARHCLGPKPVPPPAPSFPPVPAPLGPPVPEPLPPAPGPEVSPGSGTSFHCTSSLNLGSVTRAADKGMALDDTTFKECSNGIPAFFPNTQTPVKSLRLFKAWDPEWPAEGRVPAWRNLAGFVKANGIKVLLGTEVTCNETLDAQSWTWAKGFLKMLGPSHVMGLGIGNELELLYSLGNRRKVAPVTPQCIEKLWAGGRLWKQFQATVAEFDSLGFSEVPLTSVLGGYALAGSPFVNTRKSQVNTFLKQVLGKYRGRFVFTFNFYPYFDTNMHLDRGSYSCRGALGGATSWGGHGFVPSILGAARKRVQMLAPGSKVWLGETGWSSPYAPSLQSQMKNCADWSSKATLEKFYSGFLKWDMAGADHVFYFTMRDSQVFGIREYFGLLSTCSSTSCKL